MTLTRMALAALLLGASPARAQVSVHVIDVGQADAVLLELEHHAILIDAGGETQGTTTNPDRDHLLGYLEAFFTRRPELDRTLYSVILSHPHRDHTRNLVAVLDSFRVLNLVDGGDTLGGGMVDLTEARRIADRRDILYNKVPDDRIGRNGYTTYRLRALRGSDSVDIRFLGGGGLSPGCESPNNSSLVMLVTYREATFLFTGDAMNQDGRSRSCTPAITRLIRRFIGPRLDVDVLKVSHHGADNGTTVDLMTATTPEIAVISAGPRDRAGSTSAAAYGHPRESAVAMLEGGLSGTRPPLVVHTLEGVRQLRDNRRVERAVYCTCWDGDLVVSVDSSGRQFTVRAARPNP
jgi:competence protein ComEC